MTVHLAGSTTARGLYNVGSGTGRTWHALATAVFAALDLTPRIEFIDMPETLRPKYQYATRASIERLLGTGYDRPITSLEEGVADYVRGYLVPGRRLGDEPASTAVRERPNVLSLSSRAEGRRSPRSTRDRHS